MEYTAATVAGSFDVAAKWWADIEDGYPGTGKGVRYVDVLYEIAEWIRENPDAKEAQALVDAVGRHLSFDDASFARAAAQRIIGGYAYATVKADPDAELPSLVERIARQIER